MITNDHSEGEDERRQLMRDFVANFKFSSERVRFVYVSRDRQSDFVSSLVRGTTDLDPALVNNLCSNDNFLTGAEKIPACKI